VRRVRLILAIGLGTMVVSTHGAFAQEGRPPLGVAPVALAGSEETTPAAPKADEQRFGFFRRLFNAYRDEFKESTEESGPEPARRSPPSPWDSPPFPGSEYQGYPVIGAPYSTKEYPLMKALSGTWLGDAMKAARIQLYGWATGEGNWSSSRHSNMPDAYWIDPNSPNLDQFVVRLERQVDSVQTNHVDWGFRSTVFYGIDYRYTTAGGWASDQLLKHNNLYGWDPTEQYVDVYFPGVAQGMMLRVGRWIATPDIETQFAPDNYMGSHSLLFTFDTYTQTGVMLSFQLNKYWMVQAGVHAGTDMAPWYKGAVPTGFLGVRWVAPGNNDSIYLVLNSINTAKFQRFKEDGQPAGHDNFNYLVGTWTHRFTPQIMTATESYFMWQRNAVVGGTPSIGPVRSFGGGGGIGKDISGTTLTYGVLNYTMFGISKRDYLTVRNEFWRDEDGERSGFATKYTSHTIGWSHQLSDVLMIRPEVGYFHSYDAKAFDLGRKSYMWQGGIDLTVRF
jgi:hypothetical protein